MILYFIFQHVLQKLKEEEIIEKDPDISQLTEITFDGKVYYTTDFEGCASLCDQIM